MSLLLDTQVFLWFIAGSERLSNIARAEIENSTVQPVLSVASLWEMAIKISLGKLRLQQPFEAFIPSQLEQNGITLLEIRLKHLGVLIDLPFHHRDPFDRLLVAQALADGLTVASSDPAFDAYGITRQW
jgi:PIN domain nuclease of toxin-antitoxin system